jgi:hypothetical protein
MLRFISDLSNTFDKCSNIMKKIATTRKANRRPARERKNPRGVQNQLSVRRSNTAPRKRAKNPNMDSALEQPINETTELAAVEAPKNPKSEFTRGQLGKAKRAFAKAGQPDASEEVRKKWLAEMKAANVAVMNFTSSRLAKVIKGELTVSELQK